jgi:hypothetical protein
MVGSREVVYLGSLIVGTMEKEREKLTNKDSMKYRNNIKEVSLVN